MAKSFVVALAMALVPSLSSAFLVRPPTTATAFTAASTFKSSSSSALHVLPSSVVDSETARTYFYLWFFGGSGGGGVALGQFPTQFAKFRELTSMSSDSSLSQGGPTVGISPLCLYPRDLSTADLDAVLVKSNKKNQLSVEQMVARGPKPNYMSQKGYLCFTSFAAANAGCDPLTVRAVFDAMSTGDNVAPEDAQMKLDAYRAEVGTDKRGTFRGDLLKTKLAGFSSIAFLLFLLGPIVGSTCLESAAMGWFPEWSGSNDLPWSLVVGPGAWTIPQYWI